MVPILQMWKLRWLRKIKGFGQGHRTQRRWAQVRACLSHTDKEVGLKGVLKPCPVRTPHFTNGRTEPQRGVGARQTHTVVIGTLGPRSP